MKNNQPLLKIAINGMGRIGRILLKKLINNQYCQVVAINDLMEQANLNYLLKYDTALGKWNWQIKSLTNQLIINHQSILYSQVKKITNLPWKNLPIDLVLDTTGKITSQKEGEGYLKLEIKKVLITNTVPRLVNIIYGINHQLIKEKAILALGSCTTNCLSLILAILKKKYQIKAIFFNTIHAPTSDQKVLDQSYKNNWAKGRSVFNNIIPNRSAASEGVITIFPEFKNKIKGLAVRVPVITGSLLDLILEMETVVDREKVIQLFSQTKEFNLLVSKENLVSSDIIGSQYGAIVATNLIAVIGKKIRIMAWYDNESSYVSQIIKTLIYYGKN